MNMRCKRQNKRAIGGFFYAALFGLVIGSSLVAAPVERYENEWTFEYDPNGTALADALNSGTSQPRARFQSGFQDTVSVWNGALLCVGAMDGGGASQVWQTGAVLDAPLNTSGNVHYLRYDVDYQFDSYDQIGTVLGLFFRNDTDSQTRGVALVFDSDGLDQSAAQAGYQLVDIPGADDLDTTGSLTVIMEVNLQHGTCAVWYAVGVVDPSMHGHPQYTGPAPLSIIDQLRFHATGDFRPAGTDDFAAVENLRHTVGSVPGGDAWREITEPLLDLDAPYRLTVDLDDELGGAMDVGETNLLFVVVSNPVKGGRGRPVTEVTSVLTHDGQEDLTITLVGDHSPVTYLRPGDSITNRYQVIAHKQGTYRIEARGVSAEVQSDPASHDLVAGRLLEILPVTPDHIDEISGGSYLGLYEPGETLHIQLTTVNSGALPVHHTGNTLVAPPGFTVHPLDSQMYGELMPGQTASTPYEVVISTTTPPGIYQFKVINESTSLSWINSFEMEVSIRLPGTKWVKADNEFDLDQPASWVRGQVPNGTDWAVLDETVTEALSTDLGTDLFWNGIILSNNRFDWTIEGSNTLAIGSGGMDLSQAMADLRIDAALDLVSTQAWDVATGHSVDVRGTVTLKSDEFIHKHGGGAVSFSNPFNWMEGLISIHEGILSVGGANVLGRSELRMRGGVLAGEPGASLNNRMVLEQPAEVITEGAFGLHGLISGQGSLIIGGGGIVTLHHANTYSGGTRVDGRVSVGNRSALGTGLVRLEDGSVLRSERGVFGRTAAGLPNELVLNGNATLSTAGDTPSDLLKVDGRISGSSRLTLTGREVVLHGNNSFSGGLVLNQSSWLRVAGPQSLGTGPVRASGVTRVMLFSGGGVNAGRKVHRAAGRSKSVTLNK